MAVQNESERPVGWYVSRVVSLRKGQARSLGLLGGVVTPSAATLRIGRPLDRPSPLEDHVSYAAVLTFPGLLPTKLKVELVVAGYGGSIVEVGLRPAARVSNRRIGAQRYFDTAWAVLEALSELAEAGQSEPADDQSAPVSLAARASRRFARAS
jgi:hypothetical protein